MNGTTILIVEDEAIVAADLESKLRRLGYEVSGIAADGEEAVSMACSLQPHLVLMDIRLKDSMDGIEAAEAIRNRMDVPLIYLTAHSDIATLTRAKLTGPFGYILKPFDARDLATQIELALYRHEADRQVREQREWLRVTLSSIGDAVIATDAEGRVKFVNPAAESLSGWKAEEAEGLPVTQVFRVINERIGQPLEEPVGRVLREKRIVPLANHAALIAKDGRIVPIANTAAPIMDAQGQMIGAVLVFHDVTEKRRANENLRESEQRLRWALQNADGGAWDCNLESGEAWWSEEMYELYGVEPGTRMRLDSSLVLVHEQDREPLREAAEKSILQRVDFRYEFRVRHPDGGMRWMVSRGRPICDETGKAIRLIGITVDVTRRKQAEQDLAESRAERDLLFAAIEQAGESIFITGADGAILYANPAFEKATGHPRAEVEGKTPEMLLAADGRDAELYKGLWKTILSGNRWTGRHVCERKDGTAYMAECAVSPVKTRDGHFSNFVWISKDVSKEEMLEKGMAQAQRMESLGNLASGIAHDFNNILYPIVGISELLLSDLPQGSQEHENARQIFKAGKRGTELVKQILSFSRRTEPKKMPVRVEEVLEEVLKLGRSTIPSSIEIGMDIQRDCRPVMADPTQIHQIAMNLVANAFHAVEATDGKINVELKETAVGSDDPDAASLRPGIYLVLTVSDTGCGIEPENIERIFEPYFTTKKKGKGTGLGLAVAYGIVKEYGGDITVSSKIDQGTTFRIRLPAVENIPETVSVETPKGDLSGNERILLVDDEKSIAKLESNILQRLGYGVTSFVDPVEALDAFRASPHAFDLVLTDMTMPRLSGDKLARELLAIRPDIPIIVLTGFSERINKQKATAMGIKGLLKKPIRRADLACTVRKTLNESIIIKV